MEAGTFLDQFDFTKIEEILNQCGLGDRLSFSGLVGTIVRGNWVELKEMLQSYFGQVFLGDLVYNREILVQAMAAAVFSAVFTTFSSVFRNSQIAENGFVVSYLFLVSLVIASVILSVGIASDVLQTLLTFMRAFIPAFSLALTFTTGSGGALVYDQTIFMICYGVEYGMNLFVIPLVEMNVLLCITNHISKDGLLEKLEGLSESVLNWAMKSMLMAVIGIQMIQNLVVPLLQSRKISLVQKAIGVIPGIGDGVEAVSDIVLGTGMLIQNAMGAGALIVLVLCCAVPLGKLALTALMYQLAAAVIQPVADKRMVETLACAGRAARFLLKMVFVCCVLLFITVALICTAVTGKF